VQIDSSSLAHGGPLFADVAVVGAGPAGIVTALELARAGVCVLLVESGRTGFDARVQRLGDEADRNPEHAPMSIATRRQVGGASNLWGGRCVPFDPIDFERRDLAEGCEWPVAYGELVRRFQRACDWCRCGQATFDAQAVPGLAGKTLVPGLPDGDVGTSTLERWSLPTNFGKVYRRELERSRTLRLVTGLTCTEVVAAARADRVERLCARTLDGKELAVHARTYVLACGGLETTRLLLASDRTRAGGIGNHSGRLGRYYMAHIHGRIARVHFTTPPQETLYAHERDPDGVYVRRRFAFAPDVLRRERLPNTVMWLVNPELADPRHRNGVLSFVYVALASPFGRYFVAEGIRRAHLETPNRGATRAHLRNLVGDFWPAARFAVKFGYQRFVTRGRRVPGFFVYSPANVYPLQYHGEHLPHADSRVLLTDEVDELGMRRLAIRLRYDEREFDDVIRAHALIDAYLREHRCGHLEYLSKDLRATIRQNLEAGYHQTGTTRMSADPEDGVVDANLAVHGFDDLHIASSSAFVTSSQANTTFTEIVFALRLADRLRERRGVGPGQPRHLAPTPEQAPR
jgi:choline dehydrogenase-like flavoprotein